MSYNYYDLLNVPADASQDVIQSAFEEAKKIYSPDNVDVQTLFSKEESIMFLKILEEAYAVIGNSTLREIYDSKRQSSECRNSELTADALLIAQEMDRIEKAKKEEDKFIRDEAFEIEVRTCADWTGELLQRLRQYKKISVDSMCEKIKINPWYISAIENMDAENLPAPVFVRGYVIQIAKFFGLNERLIADTYMRNFNKKLGQK